MLIFKYQYPRFIYSRTDGDGYASYSYIHNHLGQDTAYYLHFYDEGLFYNGFWVVNDSPTQYTEQEGRVFIYNSENDFCPEVLYSVSRKSVFKKVMNINIFL